MMNFQIHLFTEEYNGKDIDVLTKLTASDLQSAISAMDNCDVTFHYRHIHIGHLAENWATSSKQMPVFSDGSGHHLVIEEVLH